MTRAIPAPTTVRTMSAYLSPEWFHEADTLLRSSESMSARSRGVRLVLEQRVGNGESKIIWHVRFDNGVVSMAEGPAETPDIVFVSYAETAEGIRSGALSAQAAFIAGDLRIEGSINALLEHAELFAALEDILGPLR